MTSGFQLFYLFWAVLHVCAYGVMEHLTHCDGQVWRRAC
jgi:hypothetical protein